MASPPAVPEPRPDVDSIVETIIYLYTESRRLTKGMASQFGLTGPQLTVIKLLETFNDLSLSSLSDALCRPISDRSLAERAIAIACDPSRAGR